VSRSTLLARRLRAQLLSGRPARTVTEVVGHLLAVQAQDPRGARLAIRARSSGLSASDVDRALTVDRSVIVSTVNRGTLHLMCSEDYWWLHPLTTPQLLTASARRLAQEKVSTAAADRGVEIVQKALADDGPLARDQVRERIASAGIRVVGQAFAHIMLLATIRGLIVRGPMVDGEHAFVLVADWLGPAPPALDRDVALGELARRYLTGHGPAGEADLARWAGITIGDARRALQGLPGRLVDWTDGLASIGGPPRPALPRPRLLGAFDPSLLGWASREQIIGDHHGIVTTNGIFRPFAMVAGQAVATWSFANQSVRLSEFEDISASDRAGLDAEAADVVRFLR
jgi:hypothetical protein